MAPPLKRKRTSVAMPWALMLWTGTALFVAGCYSRGAHSESYADPVAFDASPPHPARPDAGADGDDDAMKPPPLAGSGSVLLFRGQAALPATGVPCTADSGATGDRWCAFTSPSTSRPEGVDLFVVNASRAAAGVVISCGGGVVDPNCLRLTGGFFEESSTPAPHAAGFQGDTLVYFDETGTAYGWRPGMLDGRQLAQGVLHDCLPSQRGTSVLCLRDLDEPSIEVTRSELLVGSLEGTAAPPLTVADVVISADPAGTAAQVGLRTGFGLDGSDVLWSSRAVSRGPEILKTQKVGDPTTRLTIASDVSRWRFSPDGTRLYWLRQYNYDTTGKPSGTLQAAPFPAGAAPTTLLPEVGIFSITASGAIVAQTRISGSRGTLQAIPDPVAAPGNVTTLDTGVLGVLSAGTQGHVAYVKNSNPDLEFVLPVYDLYVKRLDGTGARCVISSQPLVPNRVSFTASGAGLLWGRVTNLDDFYGTPLKFRVSLTRLSDCAAMPVASEAAGFGPIGQDRVLLEDDFDGSDGRLQLKYLAGEGVVGPAPPVLIQTRVSQFVPVAGNAGMVVYTVTAHSAADGLYLYVAKPPSSSPDAGATDGDRG